MIVTKPTSDEDRRIGALRNYGVLDTPPEQALDDLAALAAEICGAPIAMVSLVDSHRQWFKAKVGTALVETSRDVSFCGHAIHQRDLFIVPDATLDERFEDNPLVTGEPRICFYAGAPLVSPEDVALGALCVIDHVPRTLTDGQQRALRVLARQVMAHLELRLHIRQLAENQERLEIVTEHARVGLVMVDRDHRFIYANSAYAEFLDLPSAEIAGRHVSDVLPDIYGEQVRPLLERAFAGERVAYELHKAARDGARHFAVRYEPATVDGQVKLVVVVLSDITVSKEAQLASLRLAAIVEFSDDAIIGKDLNSIITSWNKGAEKVFGYSAAEMVGTSITRLIPDDRQAEEEHILGKIRRGESLEHFETIRKTKDGRLIDVSVTASPIRDSTGEIIGVSKVARDWTERKRADQRLTLLDTCVSKLNDIVLVTEADPIDEPGPKIVFVNDAFERITGYSSAETIGRTPRFLQGAKTDRRVLEEIRQALRQRQPIRKHLLNYGKDGSEYWLDIDITPILDAAGKCTHFAAIERDITHWKLAEEARQATEERYRTLFEHAPDGILIANPENHFIDANASMCRMLGYAHAELIGLHGSDIIARDQISRIAAAFSDIKAALDHHQEWHFRRKDDTIFSADAIATLMPDGNVMAMVRDTTERNQAQERIAEQAALLDKARDAIVVRDLNGKILYWNNGAQRIYGWARQEAIGREVSELFYVDHEKFEDANSLVISQGEWNGELQHETMDRGRITVEARWTLIRDNEGRPKSVLAINTDITEKKKIEAQFMRAQRLESIGTLAGGVAHDLNNILAPIMMSIEVLKTLSKDPQAARILETIEVSAKRGSDIVRQVLSFSRGMEGERVEIQPAHLLNDLENIIKNTFPKDIRLRFSVPSQTWTVSGDPTQLHQILLNLCVNARDAMPDGGDLTVHVENSVLDEHYAAMNIQAKARRYVVISVTDSGMGMPPGVIDKIFEPFFTTKAVNKGTGLGLSTVMAIVKSHEGFVNVYSEPGKGTTFKVYLLASDKSPGAGKQEPEAIHLPRGNGETILLVDDESSILTITTQTLEAFGYRVLEAANGAEAVAIYAQHRNEIAVVLTDMMMPIMDGPPTIHALMRINPAVKIVAASGLNADGDVARATSAGVRHFLTKPYTAGTLLKTLRTILDEA